MSQTLGAQIFGPWYDIIGSAISAGVFYYWAYAVEYLPLSTKARLPAFMLSKKLCIGVGTLLLVVCVHQAITMRSSAAGVAPNPAMPTEWLKIFDNTQGNSIFISPSTPSRKDDVVEYWSKITFKNPSIVGQNLYVSTLIGKYVANCKLKTFTLLQAYGVSDKGQPINFTMAQKDMEASPVPADSNHPDAIRFRYVCSR